MSQRLEIKDSTIQVEMNQEVQNQIKYLCEKHASVEWSGIIFYTVEGDIDDPSNMKIIPQQILPLDVGTAGFTKYEIGDECIEYIMDNDVEEKGWLMGHIHSHNNMAVFFSGTDDKELVDNAPNHKFYFSIIVNNKHEMTAKVAQIVKTDSSKISDVQYKGYKKDGGEFEMVIPGQKVPEEYMLVYNCDIDKGVSVSEEFKTLVDNMTYHNASRSNYSDFRKKDYSNEDYSVKVYSRDNYKVKRKGTVSAIEEVLPQLLHEYTEHDETYYTMLDSLEDFVSLGLDAEEAAEYLAFNHKEVLSEYFEDANTFPLFQLRTAGRLFREEANFYKRSHSQYYAILSTFAKAMEDKLASLEAPKLHT